MASFTLRRNACLFLVAGALTVKLSGDAKGLTEIINSKIAHREPKVSTEVIDSEDRFKGHIIRDEIIVSRGDGSLNKFGYDTIEDRKQFNVRDIIVVNVYNPVKAKEDYFFMTFKSCDSFRINDYNWLFEDTPLNGKITAETPIIHEAYTYKSIFDEDIKYSYDNISVLGDTLNGYYNSTTLSVGEEITYNNFSEFVYDRDKCYTAENYNFATAKDESYSDENNLQIATQTLSSVFGYPEDTQISMKELRELSNILNEGNTLEK